jgi:hypothetical protein
MMFSSVPQKALSGFFALKTEKPIPRARRIGLKADECL